MDFHKSLSKDLIVHYAETLFRDEDMKPRKVRFFCSFFGKTFTVDISRRAIEQDIATIEAEGPSVLFDSFTNQIGDEHWQEMKAMFNQHVEAELAQEQD